MGRVQGWSRVDWSTETPGCWVSRQRQVHRVLDAEGVNRETKVQAKLGRKGGAEDRPVPAAIAAGVVAARNATLAQVCADHRGRFVVHLT